MNLQQFDTRIEAAQEDVRCALATLESLYEERYDYIRDEMQLAMEEAETLRKTQCKCISL